MLISIAVCTILQVISGDFDGLFSAFGKIFCVLAAAFLATYGMKAVSVKGDFFTLFKIFCYSQAPMLIGWIKLGPIPLGGLGALGYSMYLSILGLETVYKMQRTQAAIVVILVVMIARAIAGVLRIL